MDSELARVAPRDAAGHGLAQRQLTAGAASWYALGVLILTFMLGFADKQILGMLVDPIERDLGLTDVQLGVLQGFAFSLFHCTIGLFAGWSVDRFSRRIVSLVSLCAWSICTACCGVATGFWGIFATRVGVGVGESTMTPAGYSLIADLFPKRQLSLALGVYFLGANLGLGLSFVIGGAVAAGLATNGPVLVPLLGHLQAWQVTFLLLGLVGIVASPLFLTFREPERRDRFSDVQGLLGPAFRYLRQKPKLFASHFIGFGASNALALVILSWAPAFLGRRFGWSGGQIGPALGIGIALSGITGPVIGGLLAERLHKAGVRDAHFRIPALSGMIIVPLAVLSMRASRPELWVLYASFIYFITAASATFQSASLQMVTPNELRGRVIALFLAITALLGTGLGPLVVAAITEHVLRDRNAVGLSIGYVVIVFALVKSLAMWWGLPHYVGALDEAKKLWAKDA